VSPYATESNLAVITTARPNNSDAGRRAPELIRYNTMKVPMCGHRVAIDHARIDVCGISYSNRISSRVDLHCRQHPKRWGFLDGRRDRAFELLSVEAK
jgi:hypothetical protein